MHVNYITDVTWFELCANINFFQTDLLLHSAKSNVVAVTVSTEGVVIIIVSTLRTAKSPIGLTSILRLNSLEDKMSEVNPQRLT